MKPNKPGKLDRKHPAVAREAMEDLKEIMGQPRSVRNGMTYLGANRDRALGEADRTGRHYHEGVEAEPDEGSKASTGHEAD